MVSVLVINQQKMHGQSQRALYSIGRLYLQLLHIRKTYPLPSIQRRNAPAPVQQKTIFI